jgi:cytochrome c556
MAAHQLTQMRDHLVAIQEVMTAATLNDFTKVERSAARIESSEQMSRMCGHMGAGAPGFTEMALAFHRTADGITTAARKRDTSGVHRAVAATLQTCVACHSTYRQKIVDEAAWNRITQRN